MSDAEISVATKDGVTTLMIDRQSRRNALSAAVVAGLTEQFERLSQDAETRVIVLTGAGDSAFCAGGDIGDFQGADGMLGMHWARGAFVELMLAMSHCSKPIIARVNGHALGGGFGLMLACDLVVAESGAKLGTPEIKLGLFPMMIMAVMVRNLGRKHSLDLMLTGDKISADRGLVIGAVNHVVEGTEALDAKTEELAQKVAGFSSAILNLGRSAFYNTQDMDFEQALRTLHKDLSLNVMSEDASEGVMAFLGKRKPEWKDR